MGIFDRFKTNKEKNMNKKERSTKTVDMDKSDWIQVFSACVGKQMIIQDRCSEIVVKGQNWNVDFSKGVIAFGQKEYPIQLIGSESSQSQTWLWGWENINQFSDHLIQLAQATKATGESYQLVPLIDAKCELNELYNGHHFSIVTCGLKDDMYGYYRCAHDRGAVFVAFSNLPKDVFLPINETLFASTTMQCIQQFELDHRVFVESLLLWNNTEYIWQENAIIAQFSSPLKITFEDIEQGKRIINIQSV